MKRFLAIAMMMQAIAVCMAEDWMEQLDDNTYLSQVSIPGTHDCATGEGWTGLGIMFGPSMGLTQDLNISEQLNCGVRAFDLRPCVSGQELVINHGILQTSAKFPETLKKLCQFVTDHPTEFVVVVMRHETDGDSNSDQWADMMNNCLNSDDLHSMLADYKRDITVGELRGKVLVLSRDNYGSTPVGGFITGWGHQADYVTGSIKGPERLPGTLYLQDYYEVMDHMTEKQNGIVKLLDFSTKNNVVQGVRHLAICINHASGYTQSASTDGIRDNAAKCNQKIIDYLSDDSHAGPTGIVFMDFAGTDRSKSYDVKGLELVNTIINNNQRYTPAKKADNTGITLTQQERSAGTLRYDLQGRKVTQKHRQGLVIDSEKGTKAYIR
ncbi:MAG: hypothetical protein K6D91_08510 [Prevotella sp.]|nr:hypothetical protein [Prevotella sp.]